MTTAQQTDSRRRDLLLAIFGDESASRSAWERWERDTDLDALSRSEFALLPALSQRLESHGITHPWLTRLQGVRRYCWTANQVTRRDVVAVFSALSQAGVDSAAPVGLPVIARLYDDIAGRLADHVDVLVRPAEIEAAHATLGSVGWSAQTALPPNDLLSVCGPITYTREGHRHVLLHWHCAPAPVSASTNHALFARRQAVPLGTDSVALLDDADQLVLTCVHHRRFSPDDALLWVADAILLLRRLHATPRQSQGWERANALGVGRRFADAIADIGALLSDGLDFIPSAAAGVVRDDEPNVAVLLDARVGRTGMGRAVTRARQRYHAWSTSVDAPRSISGFAQFCVALYRYDWNVPLWRLPLTMIRRLNGRHANDSAPDDHAASAHAPAQSVSA